MLIRQSRGKRNTLMLLAMAGCLFWIIERPNAPHNSPMALSAQTPPAPYCFPNTSQPPNLQTTAVGILNTAGNQFISDYNKLSQAAWCSFIALNWAAAGNGSPTMTANPSDPLGTCANQGTTGCSLVWETWRVSNEVYTANPLPCSSGVAEPKTHLLRSSNPNTDRINPHAPGELMRQAPTIPRKSKAVAAVNKPTVNEQATGFILPDRNNSSTNQSAILYETRENPSACTTLTTAITVPGTSTSAALNLREGQVSLYNASSGKNLLPQPPPGFIQFQGSAFEVKPSWYQFPSGGPTPAQLGMISATGSNGSGGTFTVGLTGFHIIWKVFPQSSWFWMTFEYVGNNQYTQPYIKNGQPPNTYFTPTLAAAVNFYPPGGGPVQAGYGPFTPPSPVPCQSNTSTNLTNPAPCNPVGLGAIAANSQFQKLIGSTVFANYQLVGVQVAPTLNNVNTLLANNQIETDFGSTLGNGAGNPSNPSSSCITCHFQASIGSLNTSSCSNSTASAYINRNSIFAGFGSGQVGDWGFVGAFPTATYKSTSGGPYLAADFVWSVQEAPWGSGNGCPAGAKPKGAKK
jgi:hypothetical protein